MQFSEIIENNLINEFKNEGLSLQNHYKPLIDYIKTKLDNLKEINEKTKLDNLKEINEKTNQKKIDINHQNMLNILILLNNEEIINNHNFIIEKFKNLREGMHSDDLLSANKLNEKFLYNCFFYNFCFHYSSLLKYIYYKILHYAINIKQFKELINNFLIFFSFELKYKEEYCDFFNLLLRYKIINRFNFEIVLNRELNSIDLKEELEINKESIQNYKNKSSIKVNKKLSIDKFEEQYLKPMAKQYKQYIIYIKKNINNLTLEQDSQISDEKIKNILELLNIQEIIDKFKQCIDIIDKNEIKLEKNKENESLKTSLKNNDENKIYLLYYNYYYFFKHYNFILNYIYNNYKYIAQNQQNCQNSFEILIFFKKNMNDLLSFFEFKLKDISELNNFYIQLNFFKTTIAIMQKDFETKIKEKKEDKLKIIKKTLIEILTQKNSDKIENNYVPLNNSISSINSVELQDDIKKKSKNNQFYEMIFIVFIIVIIIFILYKK